MVKESTLRQTEIGLIPDDWEVKILGDIGIFTKGKGISKSEANTGNIPAIRYGEIYTKHHNIIIKFYSSISENVAKNSTELKKGDILFAGSGETKEEIGKTVAFIDDFRAYVGGDIVILRPTKNVDSSFLGYLLNLKSIQRQKSANGQGDAVVHIYASGLNDIKIPVPPLPEQQAIAEVLSDADAWIASLEDLIAKKRLIKQGAMKELLTPKEGWELKKLEEIGEVIIGLTYSPTDVREYGKLVLRSSNIQNNKLSFENNVFVDMDLPQRVIVRENDLLVCVRNGSKQLIGKCALIDKTTAGEAFGAFMSVIRSEFGQYLFYYFQTNHIQYQIDENLGATINQLTNAVLKDFDIAIPNDFDERKKIEEVLSDMDVEINHLEQKLTKARQIKQGMMQELLSGRVRLV